ncbi:AAA family ATPase [bacterium]|nr:AAA family ATPase [bacterium]MBU1071811.1 AAA family ATPase [bacterium]MBU1674532.1 AAA family ATPase [bacterium]
MIELKSGVVNEQLRRFRRRMDQMVVGQPAASERISDCFSRLIAGIHDPERPLLTMMFMGPTGVGKTETVRCLAESIFGDRRAYTRINCQEFSAHYNISKLLGSPPGYVGGEIRPLLAQENLDKHHLKAGERHCGMISEEGGKLADMFPSDSERYLSIVLFDEIEKAHPKMWNTLLGILEDGHLVLANNEEVDFTSTIIVLTTNVGSQAMNAHLSGSGIGFSPGWNLEQVDRDVGDAATREAKKIFPMEFLNRFDELVTYHTLKREHLFAILDNLISQVHHRALDSAEPFLLEVTRRAKARLVDEGTDPEYGARPLKRVVEMRVVTPVSHHICSEQIRRGDLVMIDHDGDDYVFLKEPGIDWENDLVASQLKPSNKWTRTDLGIRDDGGEKKKMVEEAGQLTSCAETLTGSGIE